MVSFPSLGQCEPPWLNGSNGQCFLPVYDKMIWYGAFAHCRRLNSTIFPGNFSQIQFVNVSHLNIKTSCFWTNNLYEIAIKRSAQWTRDVGCLINKISLWNILDTNFSCGRCGVLENCTVYLTSNKSNCTQVCKSFINGKF